MAQHEQGHVPMLGKQPSRAEHTQSGTAPARCLELRITSYPELAPTWLDEEVDTETEATSCSPLPFAAGRESSGTLHPV